MYRYRVYFLRSIYYEIFIHRVNHPRIYIHTKHKLYVITINDIKEAELKFPTSVVTLKLLENWYLANAQTKKQ